jgi:sugar lactone lactonase YvrE
VKEIVAGTGGAASGTVNSSSTANVLGSGFSSPCGVAVDGSGNVFVADIANGAVYEIVAGTGGAASGTVNSSSTVNVLGSGFNAPFGVAVDGSGDVFVGDQGNNAVKEIMTRAVNFGPVAVAASTPPTKTLTFYFDTGGTIAAPAVLTQGAAGLDFTDAGSGTCTTNGTSHTYSAGNTCTVVVQFKPTHPGQRLGAVQLVGSGGAVIATEDVYGTGTGPQVNYSIVSGSSPSLIYGPATPQSTLGSGFNHPTGVALDASGNVYAVDYGHNAVYEIPAGNGTPRALGSGFNDPIGVAVDGAGNVYVGDTGHSAVKEILAVNGSIPATPTIISLGGSAFGSPKGVAVDASGNVYVGDDHHVAVYEMSPNCTSSACVTVLGGGFAAPQGVAVDASGNVYVADYATADVYEMSPNCTSITCVSLLGGGGILSNGGADNNDPLAVAVDGVGNLYVADNGTDVVYEVLAVNGSIPANNPTINTLASGFSLPQGVAVDSRGNVYVADNATVDELDYADAPSLSFATTAVGNSSSDSPQTVTLENVGDAALSLPVPSSGFDPSIAANFTLNSSGGSACPLVSSTSSSAGTLAAGSSCTLPISFAPTAAGSISGSLVLTDNNLNAAGPGYATQSISLSGTATQIVTQLAFATAPTVNVPVGGNAGSAITVKEESSNSALDTLATDTITLTVTGPNSYSASYTATASGGIATFDLSSHALTTAGSYTYTASFTGLTSAAATETVVAPSVNFSSSENVGSSTTAQTVTVYIATAGTVNTINVLTQGAANLDFTQAASPNGGTCATTTMYSVGQTCTVGVIFAPKYPGARYGAVLLTDASGNVLGMVYLQGTGTGPQVAFLPGVQSIVVGSGLSNPISVAVDGSGNVYIADRGNNRVLKETLSGGSYTQSTLGSSLPLPSGVAVDGSGNVYIADSDNSRVLKETLSGGSYTQSTVVSGLSTPFGVAVDGSGNVYIADYGNNRVLTETLSGGSYIQSTVVSGLSLPIGVAVDGSGNV